VTYDKQIGRIRLVVSDEGMRMQDYGHGAQIKCPAGWNDSCPIIAHTVSVEELRDLRYLIDRALAEAERVSAPTRIITAEEA